MKVDIIVRKPAQPERAVVATCTPQHPLAVLRPASPRPLTGHGETGDAVPLGCCTDAIRCEHAAGDDLRVAVDRLGSLRWQERGHRRRRRCDHRTPPSSSITDRHGLDRLDQRHRVGLGTSVRRRCAHAHQPRIGQGSNNWSGKPTLLLTGRCLLVDQWAKFVCSLDKGGHD